MNTRASSCRQPRLGHPVRRAAPIFAVGILALALPPRADAATASGKPSPEAQTLARAIRANQRIADGLPGSSGYALDAAVLRVIAQLGQRHRLAITALESGGTGHSKGSYHYTGDAVDIGALDGASLTGRDARSLAIIREVAPLMPRGSGFGQAGCPLPKGEHAPALPPGVTTFRDTCNHLHIQVAR